MWIVRLALRRPYTFAVFALLLLILGPLSILNTPVDIFPNIDIPVVSIVWQYPGLSALDMANRIITQTERTLTTTVDNIEHIESQSLDGLGIVKVYFQPHVALSTAIAEITGVSQTQLRFLPQGTTPPLIITFNASTVPVLQLGLSGQGLSEQQLNDFGLNFIRTQLATIEGAASPYPYGGKQREVMIDLNLQALQARGLSPADVVNAVSLQNLILPSGTIKVGSLEYQLATNSSPSTIRDLNDIPIKGVNGAIVYIHDVAHVRDGFPPQTNIVRVDGQRASLMNVFKNGNVSTLQIISGVRRLLPIIAQSLPPQLRITPLGDQSIFVRGAIDGVVREGIIAGCLTAIMILVFLGSWRSTLIIAVSIPLSILVSLIVLRALGETINIMTLGGLALAVGILVDDATVEIENINRNLEEGKEVEQAILDGAAQIAVPAFVSTLAICIVFVPMFFLTGGQISLCTSCRSGGLCHAGLVLSLPHRGPDHGQVPPSGARSGTGEAETREPESFGSRPDGFRAPVRAVAQFLFQPVAARHRAQHRLSHPVFCLYHRFLRPRLPLVGAGFLSLGGCRPVQAPRARADGHAHRRDRGAVRSD